MSSDIDYDYDYEDIVRSVVIVKIVVIFQKYVGHFNNFKSVLKARLQALVYIPHQLTFKKTLIRKQFIES